MDLLECMPSLQEHLLENLSTSDFVLFSSLCKHLLRTLKPTIEKTITFSLPFDEQLQIFSPHKVIVFSCKSIPSNLVLTHLTLNYPLENHRPLVIGTEFNSIVNNLPSTLTNLTIGHAFNASLDNLPSTLTHLTIGKAFNKTVDKLPPNLTHLSFGDEFNQPLDHLPHTITHLTVGKNFMRPLNHLQHQLRHISICGTSSFFNMNEWKRIYSNRDTRWFALPRWFYTNYDPSSFSLFWCKFKYIEDLPTKTSMASGWLCGYYQRLEKCHQIAFGTMGIYGFNYDACDIRGVWLFCGLTIPSLVLEVEDTEYYEWTPVDLSNMEEKKRFEDFLAWEGALDDGKIFQLGNVFK